jgi:hypothetical protein
MAFFSIRKQGYNTTQEEVRICNNAFQLLIFHGFERDRASTYQQTSYAMISHFKTAKYDSAINSGENHYDFLTQSLL